MLAVKQQRIDFLKQIVNNASEKAKTNELTADELSDLKHKIEVVADTSFD
jgi:hypothetical protein